MTPENLIRSLPFTLNDMMKSKFIEEHEKDNDFIQNDNIHCVYKLIKLFLMMIYLASTILTQNIPK